MRWEKLTQRSTIPFGVPGNLDLKGVFGSLSAGALKETDGMNQSDFGPLPEKYFGEKTAEQCWENLCPPRLLENKETFIIFSLLQLSAQKDKKKYKGH